MVITIAWCLWFNINEARQGKERAQNFRQRLSRLSHDYFTTKGSHEKLCASDVFFASM